MEKHLILSILREHEVELRAGAILHLRVHGSVARGQTSPASDVDLTADLDRSRCLSLFDMASLENRLAALLGASVDLSPAHTLREPVRLKAEREAVIAF